jgi:hypothetical protein
LIYFKLVCLLSIGIFSKIGINYILPIGIYLNPLKR